MEDSCFYSGPLLFLWKFDFDHMLYHSNVIIQNQCFNNSQNLLNIWIPARQYIRGCESLTHFLSNTDTFLHCFPFFQRSEVSVNNTPRSISGIIARSLLYYDSGWMRIVVIYGSVYKLLRKLSLFLKFIKKVMMILAFSSESAQSGGG